MRKRKNWIQSQQKVYGTSTISVTSNLPNWFKMVEEAWVQGFSFDSFFPVYANFWNIWVLKPKKKAESSAKKTSHEEVEVDSILGIILEFTHQGTNSLYLLTSLSLQKQLQMNSYKNRNNKIQK